MTDVTDQTAVNEDDATKGMGIQKLYLKDASFESPNTPAVFSGEWKPQVNLSVDTTVRAGQEGRNEVILKITLEAKQGDETAFVCEVQQAGLFVFKGFEDEELRHILAVHCPTVLFPYAREAVDNLVAKGGFPSMMLQPLNFEQMYAQQQEQGQAASA